MTELEAVAVLPDILAGRIQKANEYMLQKAGKHIKRLGTLTASDLHRMEELRRASVDIREIEREIARASGRNAADVRQLLELAASSNYNNAEVLYKYRGLEHIPLNENAYMQRFIASVARQTSESLLNLSRTTAIKVWNKGIETSVAFAEGYREIIDMAVTNVSLGVRDYQSAMRQTLRALGESGLRTMEYASGHTRRLDSAVRMNLLEGIRQINQGVQDEISRELGCDGVEISVHGFCAPDHEDIQGRQLSRKEYEKWTKAHEYPKRRIGVLGCRHFAFGIITGVSTPAYSPEQLEELKERNHKGVTFEGRHYTGYEAAQVQRQLESQLRAEKDKQILAKAAGDDVLKREAQSRINLLTGKYKRFSDAAGLSYKADRVSVGGYYRGKAEEIQKTHFLKAEHPIEIKSASGTKPINKKLAKELEDEYKKFEEVFGSLSTVNGIDIMPYRNDNVWGTYNDNSQRMALFGIGGDGGKNTMIKVAKDMKKNGMWSTSSPFHVYRHELAHALQSHLQRNDPMYSEKIARITEIRKNFFESLTNLDDSDIIKKENEALSVYGLSYKSGIDDFISECIAEYLTSKPRQLSKQTGEIILKS